MKTTDPGKASHYRDRAEAFRRALNLCKDNSTDTSSSEVLWFQYGPAIALLAIHSGIALADAVLVLKTGERCVADSHTEAASVLKKMCGKTHKNADGVKHFVWLLGMKDDVSYGDRHITPDDIKSSIIKIDRFFVWMYNSFPELTQL